VDQDVVSKIENRRSEGERSCLGENKHGEPVRLREGKVSKLEAVMRIMKLEAKKKHEAMGVLPLVSDSQVSPGGLKGIKRSEKKPNSRVSMEKEKKKGGIRGKREGKSDQWGKGCNLAEDHLRSHLGRGGTLRKKTEVRTAKKLLTIQTN